MMETLVKRTLTAIVLAFSCAASMAQVTQPSDKGMPASLRELHNKARIEVCRLHLLLAMRTLPSMPTHEQEFVSSDWPQTLIAWTMLKQYTLHNDNVSAEDQMKLDVHVFLRHREQDPSEAASEFLYCLHYGELFYNGLMSEDRKLADQEAKRIFSEFLKPSTK